MKKSDLWAGIGMVMIAALCGATAFSFDTPAGSLLCGLAGALGVPGIAQIYKYFKWSRPEKAAEYQEHLEQERIDLQDERKEMLRNKAGRYAYVFILFMNCVLLFALTVLDTLGIVEADRWLIISLGVWLLVQYFAGVLIYDQLSRKY